MDKDMKSLGEYIDIFSVPKDWNQYYEEVLNSFTKDWIDINFQEIFDFYQLDSDFQKRFLKEIQILREDVYLNFLVYLWYYLLYQVKVDFIWRWKTEFTYFQSHGSFMMPVVAMLMGYGKHLEVMKNKNYDDYQVLMQKENIRLTCTRDHETLGLDGIRFSQMIWGSRFINGNIIQVGSLQYEIKKKFKILNEDVVFIHIPRNTSLLEEDILSSFSKAKEKVPKYLTTRNLKYVTESWLLSPELKDVLSGDSNIIKFQEHFDIISEEENISDFLNFVFKDPMYSGDYSDLPEDTSLQRNLRKILINQKKLHICLGILK